MKKLLLLQLVLLALLPSLAQQSSATRIFGGQYSAARINNLRNNCRKYDWARQQLTAAVEKARPWLAKTDETLWAMVPGQDLPRTIDVGYDKFASGPKFVGCIVCGDKILQYGNYPYNPDFEKKPWKLTCPACGSVFPTNDFGKYYQSALDEQGLFNPAKGDTSLLFNTDHPDPKDPLHKFGVDNGFGYVHNGRAYKYIGYYSWKYWRYIQEGLTALANAFLYTGDQRYAHKAAILLDRIADVYPSMDWSPYARRGWYHSDGSTGRGKIEGSIWETGIVQGMADAYDKILSGTQNDPALYAFLKQQGQRYRLPNSKGTRELFVTNVDEGILKTTFQAVLDQRIRGNQGMYQHTVALCALALNTAPFTTQWLDWLFAPDGGAIPELMINRFDRDGTSDEGAPGYAVIWGLHISPLAALLRSYPSYTNHNIFRDFPQFKNVYTVAYRMAVLGKAIPNIGDAGSTGLVGIPNADPKFMALGYLYTRDPEIAVAAYRANGYSAKGLGLDIFAENPEAVNLEIKKIGEAAGTRPIGGYLMSGFGLSILESGRGASGIALASNYGRTIHHAHNDMLNFDLFAFGHWLTPDLGYPEFATNIPSVTEWTRSTISHNLVFANKRPQGSAWSGHTRLFKQLNGFGAFELDGKAAYPDLKTYSRTLLLVGGSSNNAADSNAYVVDIFRVRGGNDHVFSFHGPPGAVRTEGLQLQVQEKGTYAGTHISKGTKAAGFPYGYSFLYNVEKDTSPPASFIADWKAQPGYRGLTENDHIHIRMHATTSSDDVSLADGDPPQNKPGNPKTLRYLLMHRAGSDLTSNFVTILEPYRNHPFIKSVRRMDNGKEESISIRVEKADGTVDYLVYNPAAQNGIQLANGIAVTGTIGYIQEKSNRVTKAILINGTALTYKKASLTSAGTIEGHVVKMYRGLGGEAWITVDTKQPVNKSLIGEQIMIETKGERDACYRIRDIKKEGTFTRIFFGPGTFVSNIKKGSTAKNKTAKEQEQNYSYDFEEGAAFKIATHASWNIKK
ncbi:heparinase II/III-family protein [Niabella sp. CC-SYL272]|uniref:heparinase II/III domain-containing protein n=1 Tax=Niabella agricola TaxID=2891571 RepID=UPI001F34C5FC|nr:heparinase II/III family protein [Niabella agricola]MCF3108770.1 heparinase II/III-family protein [Niabella agricola]